MRFRETGGYSKRKENIQNETIMNRHGEKNKKYKSGAISISPRRATLLAAAAIRRFCLSTTTAVLMDANAQFRQLSSEAIFTVDKECDAD
jgi:hypothetical protein